MANGLLLFMTDIDPAHEGEFNRWYEGGRLPLFRTKRLHSQKAARSFLRSEVAALAAHVALWRAQDAIRQVRRRHGLRSV